MVQKTFFWRIFPAALLPAIGALVIVAGAVSGSLRRYDMTRAESELEARVRLFARSVQSLGFDEATPDAQQICADACRETNTRFTLIRPDGRVLADSESDPARMENHRSRPEVVTALSGRVGRDQHFSRTLFERQIYVAIPIIRDGRVAGVVRGSLSLTQVEEAIRTLQGRILAIGALATVVVILVVWPLARELSRPIESLTSGAERFAAGDLTARVSAPNVRETDRLANVLNSMAGELDRQMTDIVRQNNAQAAILASMVEGVIAVDAAGRISDLNPAAARWMNVSVDEARGHRMEEVIRHSGLADLLARTRVGPAEHEIELPGENGGQTLHVHASPIWNREGGFAGAVLVLHDITTLRRLEHLRRDFVANVSHELKTPLTSISAASETLRDQHLVMDGDGQHFVEVIQRQAERLNRLVEDLLELSRIEHETERGGLHLEIHPLRPVLESAIQAQSITARERGVQLDLDADAGMTVRCDPLTLEQAVSNLVHNAVKFSPEGGSVTIRAMREASGGVIEVEDRGAGIAAEHLSRLFERFYRVDRGRSRRMGGTGLGLAIVKHIALAHGGRVSVESTPGQGSTFRIHLPPA